MTLALRLGKTLSELTESMTMTEFNYWMAFDRISPIGDHRGDIHAAQITCAVYQSQGIKANYDEILLDFAGERQVNEPDDSELINFFNKLM